MTDHALESTEEPEDLWLLDRLLEQGPAADHAAEHRLAMWLAAVQAPAEPAELSGLSHALAAFTARVTAQETVPPVPVRHSRRAVSRAARLAAIAGAGVIVLGGTAAAAYNGDLPRPLQELAHKIPGVPASHGGEPTTTSPPKTVASTVPNPEGRRASSPVQPSVAPTTTPSETPGAHQSGKPSTHPSHAVGKPSTHPSHPTGKPSTHPSHPTGKPSAHPGKA
jgi:hypothetical protein